MPPKGGAKHQKDWSWLEDLGSADEITLAHRRRAAGLGPSVIQKVCPIRQRKDGTTIPEAGKSNGLSGVPERNGNGKRAISVDSTGTESSIQFVKETSCTAKKCAGNPRCYNFLGMDKVSYPGHTALADGSGGRMMPGIHTRVKSSARS